MAIDWLLGELKKHRLDGYEIYKQAVTRDPIIFKHNELHSFESKKELGIGLRVIRANRIGFASTNNLANLKELVRFAINSAQFGAKAGFEFPGALEKQAFSEPAIKAATEVEAREWIEQGKMLIDQVLTKEPGVKVSLQIDAQRIKVDLVNSSGFVGAYEKTIFEFLASAFAIIDSSFVFIWEYESHCRPYKDVLALAERITDKLARAKHETKICSKAMPVIMVPQSLYFILQGITLGVNGLNIEKGTSPLTSRLGEQIFSPQITVVDDGTIDHMVGSAPFDDEGTSMKKTVLYDRGVLNNYIFDLKTAARLQGVPTGHGSRRSYSRPPSPMPNNVLIEPGTSTLAQIIEHIAEGLIVYSVIGGGQSNLLAGDFSVNVGLGFKIERGEVKGRVKDTMIAGNIYEAFRNVGAVAKTPQVVGAYKVPAILFDALNVATKG